MEKSRGMGGASGESVEKKKTGQQAHAETDPKSGKEPRMTTTTMTTTLTTLLYRPVVWGRAPLRSDA